MTLVTIVHRDHTQLTPIIFAFKEKVKYHILVCDAAREEKKVAQELAGGIDKINERYRLNTPIRIFYLDEDNPNAIEYLVRRIGEIDSNPYLNAAGADIALTVLLAKPILEKGGTVLAYDRADNSYNVLKADVVPVNRSIEETMGVEDFLTINGELVVEKGDKYSIRKIRGSINSLFDMGHHLVTIIEHLETGRIKQIVERYPDLIPHLRALKILEGNSLHKNYQRSYLGYLLESFIFLRMEGYDFDDLQYNVLASFEYQKNTRDTSKDIRNEFDVVCIKDNRPGFVECKIGRRSFTPLSVIYKNDALMDYFGAHSRSLIVNIDTALSKRSMGKSASNGFGPNHFLRARSKRIGIFYEAAFDDSRFNELMRDVFNVRRRVWLVDSDHPDFEIIKTICKHCGQRIVHRSLGGNGSLEDFQDRLNDREHFYTIDLIVDENQPEYITFLDGSKGKKATEQVAEILDCMYLLEK